MPEWEPTVRVLFEQTVAGIPEMFRASVQPLLGKNCGEEVPRTQFRSCQRSRLDNCSLGNHAGGVQT